MYWKALNAVPPLEMICHRIVWCMVLLGIAMTLQRRWGRFGNLLRSRRCVLYLMLTAVLLAVNWFIFVWAVNNNHVVETSLGYYINPLVNALLGFLVFRDTLNRRQSLAIAFAVIGVLISVVHYGRLPWIALALAFSFALYGLIRKIVDAPPIASLFFETLLLTFPAGGVLIQYSLQGTGAMFAGNATQDMLLFGAGLVTAVPLLFFNFAVQRLRLVTVGIMQYIAPTGMFLLGVFRYGEEFGLVSLVTFCCIWLGVIIYLMDGINLHRQESRILRQRSAIKVDRP